MSALHQMGRRTLVALAAATLAACAAPQFKQPDIAVPAAFKEASGQPVTAADGSVWQTAQPAEAQPRGQWWLAFKDPALTALIDEASVGSAGLEEAAARLRQARAIAGIAEADRSVQVGVEAGAVRQKASPTSRGLPDGSSVAPATAYHARLTASYEVDLFGRVSSSVTAAGRDATASEATYRSVLLALQADVAQTYFRLRALDAELATLGRTVSLREQSVKLTERRYALGDIGEFDVTRARTELSTARAEAIGLQQQRAASEHALAVLLGRPAASFSAAANPLENLASLPVIPAGLPSSLLQRRPDIATAQHAMEAANARIGVARAAMFPALALTSAAGGEGGSAADVLTWSSRSWLLGALLSAPLIDGGRNRNNVVRSEAALAESVGSYRQHVLVAFAEVEDSLSGLRILAAQAAEIDAAVASARRSAELAQLLYDAGRTSYIDLLEAQRNLSSIERSAVQLRGQRAITTVALVRALGGGWSSGDKPV